MKTIYVTYNERRSGGEPESSERYCSRSDTIIEYNLKGASVMSPKSTSYYNTYEVAWETLPSIIYVVLVRYKSGDTFGSSYGNGYVEGVYADEASAAAVMQSISGKSYKGYAPWDGYFERLESVDVEPLMLAGHEMSKSQDGSSKIVSDVQTLARYVRQLEQSKLGKSSIKPEIRAIVDRWSTL
jgi:hypothetical protein